MSIEMAAEKIVKERMFQTGTVRAEDGGKAARMRALNQAEKKQLERRLYPSVFD